MGKKMIYRITSEGGRYRVYRLLDPNKGDKESNRRYCGSFDNEERAREYKGALETMPEPEGEG